MSNASKRSNVPVSIDLAIHKLCEHLRQDLGDKRLLRLEDMLPQIAEEYRGRLLTRLLEEEIEFYAGAVAESEYRERFPEYQASRRIRLRGG